VDEKQKLCFRGCCYARSCSSQPCSKHPFQKHIMPKYELRVKIEAENIKRVYISEPSEYTFKVKCRCDNCREETENWLFLTASVRFLRLSISSTVALYIFLLLINFLSRKKRRLMADRAHATQYFAARIVAARAR
jgi:Eukaryotic protein of unknown function (DUF866)